MIPSMLGLVLSYAFNLRICFGKTDFHSLYFAVDQVLSISGYDLENGRMLCKQKY